jgi:hypothetical protein
MSSIISDTGILIFDKTQHSDRHLRWAMARLGEKPRIEADGGRKKATKNRLSLGLGSWWGGIMDIGVSVGLASGLFRTIGR